MEPFSLTAIAAKIVESLLEDSAKTGGGKLLVRIRQSRALKKRVAEYVDLMTNRVSYLTLYRALPQQIDEAFVMPRILDSALVRTHLEPGLTASILAKALGPDRSAQQMIVIKKLQSAERRHMGDLEDVAIKYVEYSDVVTGWPRILVLGESGAGKSTLLAHLCRARLRMEKPRLPVFLVAKDLQTGSIGEALKKAAEQLSPAGKDSQWAAHCVSLYIDALDELPPERLSAVSNEIGRLVSEAPTLEVAVTCRSAAYHGELSFLRNVTLLPFDADQGEEFVRRWFSGVNEELGLKLITILRKSPGLRQLSTHPLLLSLMCSAYLRFLDVSRRQTTLFEQCLDALLWKWDTDRGFRRTSLIQGLDLEKRKWLHSMIAVGMHEIRATIVDRATIESTLRTHLPRFGISSREAPVVLDELCSHHGILVKWTEEAFGFGHLALQEYLTGKWYSNEQRWMSLLRDGSLRDSWWENVFAFCCASLSDATHAMESLSNESSLPELDRLRLLSLCLKLDPIVAPGLRDGVVRRILNMLHNGASREHDMALWMLVGLDDAWTNPAVKKSLGGLTPTREQAKARQRATGGEKG